MPLSYKPLAFEVKQPQQVGRKCAVASYENSLTWKFRLIQNVRTWRGHGMRTYLLFAGYDW